MTRIYNESAAVSSRQSFMPKFHEKVANSFSRVLMPCSVVFPHLKNHWCCVLRAKRFHGFYDCLLSFRIVIYMTPSQSTWTVGKKVYCLGRLTTCYFVLKLNRFQDKLKKSYWKNFHRFVFLCSSSNRLCSFTLYLVYYEFMMCIT